MGQEVIRRALAWAAAVLAAFGAVWAMGRRQGTLAARVAASERKASDLSTAIEVARETDAKTDDTVRADLNRWMRPD
jgi:hypothetical protein